MICYSVQRQRQKLSSNYMELWRTSLAALEVPNYHKRHFQKQLKVLNNHVVRRDVIANPDGDAEVPQEHVECGG